MEPCQRGKVRVEHKERRPVVGRGTEDRDMKMETEAYLAAAASVRHGETWIGHEEAAYNVPLAGSGRFGRVRFPDGKLRRVRLGVPDSFFSIPARVTLRGKTVSGFVTVDSAEEFIFVPNRRQ